MRSVRLSAGIAVFLVLAGMTMTGAVRAQGSAFSVSDDTTTESSKSVCSVTVTLSPASSDLASVQYKTDSGYGPTRAKKATIREDFEYQEGTLDFAPGTTTQTVNVKIKGDNFNEKPARKEYFTVDLLAPEGATIADGQGICTIVEQKHG